MTGVLDKKYGELLKLKQPHVIRNQSDYDQMSALAKELVMKQNRSTQETELLKLVGVLIDQWQKNRPAQLPKATPLDVLEYLMEENNHKAADLCNNGITDKGTLSKILTGNLAISKSVAMRLAKLYKVNPALFISFESSATS